jgi:ketosteroid isomerase-like protein
LLFLNSKRYGLVMSQTEHAWAWLRRHEEAFNAGDVDRMVADYALDAVLEAHVGGDVLELAGPSSIRDGLATMAGRVPTKVQRVVAGESGIAAQIVDANGRTVMTSFWEVRHGRIVRDVSIVTGADAQQVPQTATQVASDYVGAVNERSTTRLRSLFAPDAAFRHPTGTFEGSDAICRWHETVTFAERPRLTAVRVTGQDTTVVLEVRAEGAPDRSTATTWAVDVFEVDPYGLVTALDVYYR